MMNINRHGSEETCILSDEQNDIDRISSLPDDIRTHILSFLSTREAAQTSILSKGWINTWASSPNLDFDIEEFGLPKNLDDDMALEYVTKFKQLVKSALRKRETSCVNRFRLWLNSGFYWPCTQAFADCIGDVMKLGPRECLAEMGLCENFSLNTDLIFTCASLIKLQLYLCIEDDCVVDIEPNLVNLPYLKILNLDGAAMSNNSFKKLLLGCPVLEELVLEKCYIDTIEICSNTLKKLVLWSEYGYEIEKLQISTPNLLYLDINIISLGEIVLLNFKSLVDASISTDGWDDWYGWYDQDKYVTSALKLIHSLSNVESLRLHALRLYFSKGKVLSLKKDFYNCPVFNNLKCLKLVNWRLDDFDCAPLFLLHSPKLHELTLEYEHQQFKEFFGKKAAQEGPKDAFVQREFLKTVRIVGFENSNEFVNQLINKLLAHVKIIGDIVIDLSKKKKKKILLFFHKIVVDGNLGAMTKFETYWGLLWVCFAFFHYIVHLDVILECKGSLVENL